LFSTIIEQPEDKTTPMRKIGYHIQAELKLSDEEVGWLLGIAQALLRAFSRNEGPPISHLAEKMGIARQTLYTTLRLVVASLVWVYRHKAKVDELAARVQRLEDRLTHAEHAEAVAQAEVHRLTQALNQAQDRIANLQAQVKHWQAHWQVTGDRLIVVLKLAGRCTVRSIVDVLAYGWGVSVSVGYVQGIIAQAGITATSLLDKLLKILPLSGAICVDECFFKEMGLKMLGVVIVDPLSGLVLRLERCVERSTDAMAAVLEHFNQAGFKDQIKLCLTDMYDGYLKPVKTYLPQAVHQFCWFHINCFHIGAAVRQAKRAYEQAVKDLDKFDKQHAAPLSPVDPPQRAARRAARDQAYRHWQGAQRFQHLVTRLLGSPTLAIATTRLEQLIRVAPKVENVYVQKMGAFLAAHRVGLLVFFTCLESAQHTLKRLSRSQQQWVRLTKRWAVPITSNAAEHVFRCLRRYTNSMDHFGTEAATQRFFDLFVFHHNVHILRAGKHNGNSLLAAAHINVRDLFGTDDPYTMLGFPPVSQAFTPVKSVQSVAV